MINNNVNIHTSINIPQEGGVVNIWQENFPVRFSAIDKSDRLTLDMVFNYFQEAAISHAESLGCGREAMAQTGQGWVLSRLSVLVERRPSYRETITVRTWPKGREKLFAIRYFDIRDKDDIQVIKAKSSWLIVDIEKRRPIRPDSIMDRLPPNNDEETLMPEDAAAGLKERDNLQFITERKALYTDIDFNGHVNNVSYVKWIEDAVNLHLGNFNSIESAGKMRMDINYLNEILPGEAIEILYAPIEDPGYSSSFAFEGRKKETGFAAFRAELRI